MLRWLPRSRWLFWYRKSFYRLRRGTSLRLRSLQVNLLLEGRAQRFFKLPVRVFSQNSAAITKFVPNHWGVERILNKFSPYRGWQRYTNYVYLIATVYVSLLSNKASLLVRIVAAELRKTYRHSRLMCIVETVIRNLLVFNVRFCASQIKIGSPLQFAVCANTVGVKVVIKGCFNRRKRKGKAIFAAGYPASLQTFRNKCSYAFATAITYKGSFGVHVFIFHF
jgi:hypothetical protein